MSNLDNTRQRAINQTAVDESLLDQGGEAITKAAIPERSSQRRQLPPETTQQVAQQQPAPDLNTDVDTKFIDTMDIPGLELDMSTANKEPETVAETTTTKADKRTKRPEVEAARALADQQKQREEALKKLEAERAEEIAQATALANAEHAPPADTPADVGTEPTTNVVDIKQHSTRRSLNTVDAGTQAQTTMPSGVQGQQSTARRPLVSRELVGRLQMLNNLDADSVESQLLSIRDMINAWEKTTGAVKQAHLLNIALALAPVLEE